MLDSNNPQSPKSGALDRFVTRHFDRYEQFAKDHTAFMNFLAAVLAIVVAFFFFVLNRDSFLHGVSTAADFFLSGLRQAPHSWVSVSLGLLLCFAGVVILRQRATMSRFESDAISAQGRSTELEGKLERLEADGTKKDGDELALRKEMGTRRWENLRPILYRPMAYEPLLHQGSGGLPVGFGLDLLSELMSLPRQGQKSALVKGAGWMTWDEIERGFEGNPCEIIATPLFATSERSKYIRFSTPLFFSNIGFYTTKAGRELICRLRKEKELVSISDLVAALQSNEAKSIKVLYIDGEISQKMAKKHASEGNIVKSDKSTLGEVLTEVAEAAEIHAVFCESYTGHNVLKANGLHDKVVNVLLPYEILYPVCYAIRLGDYQLANLINLQIMARFTCVNGAVKGDPETPGLTPLSMLKATLMNPKKSTDNVLTIDEVSEHFIDHFPFPVKDPLLAEPLTRGASHA